MASVDPLVFVGVGATVAASLSYLVYSQKEKAVNLLRSVSIHEVGSSSLESSILNAVNGFLPVIGVTGIISADDKPLTSDSSSELKCVIKKTRKIEHTSVWSTYSRAWYDEKRTVSEKTLTVPFSLASKDHLSGRQCRVLVGEPLTADVLDLVKIHDSYDETKSSFMDMVVAAASGEKSRGMETIEEVLPIHTTLLAIGQLRNINGKYTLSSPDGTGARYVLSTSSIRSLITTQEKSIYIAKIVSIVLSVIACGSLGYVVYKTVKKYLRDRRQRKEIEELRAVNSETDGICVICLVNKRDVVVLNCGHVSSCSVCLRKVAHCPICRGDIAKVVPIFPC